MTVRARSSMDEATIIVLTDDEEEAKLFVQLVNDFTVYEANYFPAQLGEYTILIWNGPRKELNELVDHWNKIRSLK